MVLDLFVPAAVRPSNQGWIIEFRVIKVLLYTGIRGIIPNEKPPMDIKCSKFLA